MIVGSYRPILLPVNTPQGEITALVLASNPAHDSYVGELPLAEAAATIATGSGVIGTNLHYLEQLAEKLEQLQIEDRYIERLLERVRRIARA
jgi:cation transport protein ChaC